ncbi:MAG: dienelactone hydrolase family protein [Alphaproteobacteria bacterium]|nr:dienelactone hydrolase family protein [Alphaproteobacteria bacterium]
MAEPSQRRRQAAKGRMITIGLDGRTFDAYAAVHHSGTGPGLLLLADDEGLDAGMRARADLLGEEGYSVLALGCELPASGVAAAAKALGEFPATDGGIGAIGHGAGGALACRAARDAGLKAIVAFDAPALADEPELLSAIPCPIVLQFGTNGAPVAAAAASRLRSALDGKDGSRVYDWPEAGPGFAIPGRETFHKRADGLAHTRTLELVRRVLGPYYDFAALFAAHAYHEFTTRDVDAAMATMIDEPYVNHVPTLAGGVGHDMLKRFYKYHFVDQNAGGRDRTRISTTLGPDRLVVESYTKFRHDSVIDRYFPGIEPTGKMVEIATVIIVKFRGDKVCHEHLYWDQGSALKQIGVLDAEGLPLAGAEAARKVLDETQPSNIFMADAWATSAGKPI